MAAENYIQVTGQATRLNSQIRVAVDALQNVITLMNALKATLAQSALDVPGNASALATATGLSADDASALNTLIASATSDLNASAFIAQLLARCG